MAYKYQRFDRKLFAWLRANRDHATTAGAIAALQAGNDKTQKRHISRRFSQLEDRGVLKCTLKGTTRICQVVDEIPTEYTKQPWREGLTKAVQNHLELSGRADVQKTVAGPSIRAANSEEFLANGGTIQKLPTHWDTPAAGSKPLGDSFSFDD